MPLLRRLVVALLVLVLPALVAPRAALAWVDLTVARDDVRVTVDEAGQGIVEHAILILVAGGPLTEVTVAGVDTDADVLEGAHLVREGAPPKGADAEDELPIDAKRVETKSGGTDLVLSIDEGRGVRRGKYWIHLRYRTNLHAKALRVEGTRAILEWSGPTWDYGLDTTRATFVLPASRMEPTVHEGVEPAGTFIPSVRVVGRQAELTLVRPYAARGERVTWPVEFDARVLARGADEAAAPTPVVRPSAAPLARAVPSEFAFAALGGFVLVFALFWAHGREASARAQSRGGRARPVVPLPSPVRALIAAIFFASGAWLVLCEGATVLGSAAIVVTTVFGLHGNATQPRALRKPGTWLFVRKEEAFLGAHAAQPDLFDLRSLRAKGLFAALVLGFGALAGAVAPRSLELALTAGLALTPVAMLFVTGDRRHQRPDLTVDVLPFFSRTIAAVEKKLRAGVRVATRVRMPEGSEDADELRVVFMPDRAERGLRSIELAMEPHVTALGAHLRPVVLVRFEADSPALERAKKAAYASRIVTGRSPTERVVVLTPKLPTVRVTVELVLALIGAMRAAKPKSDAPMAGSRVASEPAARRKPPVKSRSSGDREREAAELPAQAEG